MSRWFKTTQDKLVNLDDFARFDVEGYLETFVDGNLGLVSRTRWYVVGIDKRQLPAVSRELLVGPYATKEEAVKEGYACLLGHLEVHGGIRLTN